jgi:hypothetical protein
MASECDEDVHCFPGSVCRAVTTGATGVVVRRCTPEGERGEGEPCDFGYVSPGGACREGLVCLSGTCGVRCRLDEPLSCPDGHSCEDSLDGPACHADCRKLGCPRGERCKRLGDSEYRCLARIQGDCPETPCGPGERCNAEVIRAHGVFWCARICNPLLADSCPGGQICGMGSATVSTCFSRCDPLDLDSCGKGWRCTTVSEDLKQWGCMPASTP